MARSEELRLRAGDLTLAATLNLPEGTGRLPCVLLVPSWLPRDRDGGWDRVGHPAWFAPAPAAGRRGPLARLADALAAVGVASLRYDPRGCGESQGSWEGSDLFARIDDARDAIGAMRSRAELDLRRMAVLGHGEGAVVAMSVAIGDPAIGAVGLVCPPARSLRDLLRRGSAVRSRTGVDREHPAVAALDDAVEELIERAERREPTMTLRIGEDSVQLALAGWEQGIHTPALALATMVHRNVVIVSGTADAWASPDEAGILAALLVEAGNAPHVDEIEDAGHDLAEADDERMRDVAAALADRIESRELPPVLLAIESMGEDG